MPWVGFEPTIPAPKRAKTVHGLDRAATMTEPLRIKALVKYIFFGATALIWAFAYLLELAVSLQFTRS
jgi:hypothetical protein